jgi:hypothetical protein
MGGSTLLQGKVFHGGSGNASSLQHAYVEVENLKKRQEEAAIPVKDADELAALIASLLIDPQIATHLNTELSSEFNWKIKVRKAQDQPFSCARGGALFVLQKLFNRPSKLIQELAASPSR